MPSKYVRRRTKDFIPLKDDPLDKYRMDSNPEQEKLQRIFPHESKESLVGLRTSYPYKGDWLPNVSYDEGDQVTYGASLYHATRRSTNIRPNVQNYWKLMSGTGGGGGGASSTKVKPHLDVDLTAIILPPSADIVWDMSLAWIGRLTLDAPTNLMGSPINLTQHGSGKLYLDPNGQSSFAWSADWDWNGSPPAMPVLGKGLIIAWDCPDGLKCVCGVFAEYTL